MCDHACLNNPALGCCGNSCPQDNPGTANVYEKDLALEQYTAPNAVTTSATQAPSSAPIPVNSQLVTASGPAPGVQSQSTVDAVSQSASTQSSEPCTSSPPAQYQTPEGQAPQPKAYETSISIVDAVQATTTDISTSAPNIPQYESTMATKAAPSNHPYGEAPVPSQVPGSDSAPGGLPSFSSLGGIALIAVMIM